MTITIRPASTTTLFREYYITPNYVLEDNETYIRRGEIETIYCEDVTQDSKEDYCNSFCGADEMYFAPYTRNDLLYFQWRLPFISKSPTKDEIRDEYVWLDSLYTDNYTAQAELYDLDGTLISDVIENFTDKYGMGIKNKQGYQYLSIDTSKFNNSCFYLKVIFTHPITGEVIEWYSEIFREIICDEETVEIEGIYPTYSQDNEFFGEFEEIEFLQSQNNYKLNFRIPASFELIGHEVNNTLDERSTFSTRSNVTDIYRLRTEKVPEFIANKLTTALAAKELYINGIRLYFTGKISKEFDNGQSWTITIELTTFNNELVFGCANQ